MKGGYPAAMWKNAGSGFVAQLGSMFSGVKDDASRAAATVSQAAENGLGSVSPASGSSREVFTWKDADGVTHFSSVAPNGEQSTMMRVNPDQNVLAPIEVPKAAEVVKNDSVRTVKTSESDSIASRSADASDTRNDVEGYSDPAVQEVADQLGGDLPGVVGKILSSQSGDDSGTLNPNQLIKMLQSN